MLDGFDFITRLKIEFLLDVTIFCFIGIMFVCLFVCLLMARQPSVRQGLLIIEVSTSHTTTSSQSIRLLWTSDQLVAETSDNTQHSLHTDIHAPIRIRTHNLSRRAAADLRLRPRNQWDRNQHNRLF